MAAPKTKFQLKTPAKWRNPIGKRTKANLGLICQSAVEMIIDAVTSARKVASGTRCSFVCCPVATLLLLLLLHPLPPSASLRVSCVCFLFRLHVISIAIELQWRQQRKRRSIVCHVSASATRDLTSASHTHTHTHTPRQHGWTLHYRR